MLIQNPNLPLTYWHPLLNVLLMINPWNCFLGQILLCPQYGTSCVKHNTISQKQQFFLSSLVLHDTTDEIFVSKDH